jgi:RHS repeat-associated protein
MAMSLRTCRSDPRFVGDPIDVTTGANTDIITDLAQRGPLPFRWTRYYNSACSNVQCSLGWGHSHHFDRLLVRDLDGLRYQDPLGGAVGFREPTSIPIVAGGMELMRTDLHTFVIGKLGQPDQVFHFTPGSDVARLARLESGANAIELHYSTSGALREIVDEEGRLICVTSDQAGRILKLARIDPKTGKERIVLLTYEYDGAGNLVRATDRYNTTLTFAYDAGNRMTRRTDRRGYSFHFEYDDQGRCIHSRGDDGLLEVFLDYQPDAGTTMVRRGDGGLWIYHYNDNKTITQITDPYGNATKFMLDDSGRPVQEIDPNGNVTLLHCNRLGEHDYRIDPNGHALPTREADPNPPDPLEYVLPTTALEWDFGSLVDAKTIRPLQAGDPILAQFSAAVETALADAPGATSQGLPQTDDFGRPLEHTGPRFSEKWKYDANGNLIEHRDRDGSMSRFTHESWNSLKDSIDPLGNVTSFAITVQGLVAKITDPGGAVTEYEYDLREKLVEVREAGGFVERYRRDSAGNRIEKIDSSGQTQARWEIGPGNLAKARILGSGEKHLFEYDANGRVTKIETPACAATLGYDDEANVVADLRGGMGVVHEIEFKSLVNTTYFDKFKVNYRTADNGDLVIEDPTGAKHRFQFGRTGLIVKHLANGSRELCQYDSEGRCHRKALVPGNTTSHSMCSYGYSGAGDLVVVADTHRGTTKYRHDELHRILEKVRPNGTALRFEHDRAGNVLRQPSLANVVVGEANRLKEANGDLCTYNIRGHLSERLNSSTATRYRYDDLDNLVQCDLRGEPWTASYDGLNRRVQKNWRGETTTYYWDDFRLAAEVRHNGSVRLYIYADHKALAPFLFIEYESLEAAPESGKRFYVFTNQVAAPVLVGDDLGQTVWSASIGPYGTAEIDPTSTVEMPLRFPGHYFDPETGLHYNRNRYYSPELGRYLQTDPAGQAGNINPYAYPSNPLTTVDIDGLKSSARRYDPEKHPAPHEVKGCPVLAKPMIEGQRPGESKEQYDARVKAELRAHANALQDQIDAAMKKRPRPEFIELPNGQVLDIKNKDHLGPCISVAVDNKTGKVFYGQNMDNNEPPQGLHPPLQQNAQAIIDDRAKRFPESPPGKTPSDQSEMPGNHSEVQAVSQGMYQRDKDHEENPNTPHPPEVKDFTVHNQGTDSERNPKPCCTKSNAGCRNILGTNDGTGANDVSCT